MGTRVVGIPLLCALVIDACSAYTAISPSIAPMRGTIRLSLNDAGRNATLGGLGAQITSVEGRVRSMDDSTFTIAVSEVGHVDADSERRNGETVAIPSRYVAGVERKNVQVVRTLLLAAAIVGGAIWIGSQGHGDASPGRTPGPPVGGQ